MKRRMMMTERIDSCDNDATILYRMKKVRDHMKYEKARERFVKEYHTEPMNAHGPSRVILRMANIISDAREKKRVPFKVISVLLMDHQEKDEELMQIVAKLDAMNVYVGTKEIVDGIVGIDHALGTVSAICAFPTAEETIDMDPPFLIFDGVSSSENIGSILRTAAAMGVTSILCSQGTLNGVNTRCSRVSMGCCFYHRFSVPKPKESLAQAVHRLRQEKPITVYAAETKDAGATSMVSPHPDRNWALIVGNERDGISEELMQAADRKVYIPQYFDSIDSMNVGHATAICLFELGKDSFRV